MPAAPNESDGGSPEPEEVVMVRVNGPDVARLDVAAARRGVDREEIIEQAIDAFLARETWSGGFIAPPPPMEVPGPFPWGQSAFSFRRRK